MVAFVKSLVCRRVPRACLVPLILSIALFTGCEPDDVHHGRQVDVLKTELEETKRRLAAAQKSLVAKEEELLVATTALESAKVGLADKDQAIVERDTRLRTALTELQTLRKSEALVFAEIRTLQMQGKSALALSLYHKFINDFPTSPLAGTAASAIAEMTAPPSTAPRPPGTAAALADPKRREREFQKTFNEGYMKLEELAPVLKKKSLAQVLALLGKPNQTFNEGMEIGYADKAINPATGKRGVLIISFESGTVATLRVEYSGRKVTP